MANQERKVVWVFTNFLETGTGIQDGHTHTHTQSSAFRVVGFEVTNIIQRLSEYNPCYKKKKKAWFRAMLHLPFCFVCLRTPAALLPCAFKLSENLKSFILRQKYLPPPPPQTLGRERVTANESP